MATASNQVDRVDLDLTLIVLDPEIQPRESMDHDVIAQYAADMLAGVEFPRVVAYYDGERYWLSQGFHRCMSAESAGLEAIPAEVRDGTRQDAMWDAACSNREHDSVGMRRSNADKRRAVRMALEARPKLSDTQVAREVGVDIKTVGNVRTTIYGNSIDKTRVVTRNGVSYEMNVGGIGRTPELPVRTTDEGWRESRLHMQVEAEPSHEPLPGQVELPITAPDPTFEVQSAPAAIGAEMKPASRPTFNQTNEMVDWARWTWNPVTGCEHTCFYCYARDIANRFYKEKFAPTYRPERLEAPRNTNLPVIAADEADPIKATSWRNVFVCSMADLFGRWVPQHWIDGVFDSCRKSPEWNYLFLTKFPQRYVDLDFPATAWVGTSVDEQKRVPNAEKAFRKIQAPVKWLSIEPMLEPITFTNLSMFDWVVIGGQSRSSGGPGSYPDPTWVVDLICKAKASGCAVYCKPNTDPGGCCKPDADPSGCCKPNAGYWSRIFQEYPKAFLRGA